MKKTGFIVAQFNNKAYFCHAQKILAVVAQLVEHRLPKPRVTGSSPACRSFPIYCLGLLVALSTLLSGLILTNKKKEEK